MHGPSYYYLHILGVVDLELELVQASKLNLLQHAPLRANLDRSITNTLVAVEISPVVVATAASTLTTLLLASTTESTTVGAQALELGALLTLLTKATTATTLTSGGLEASRLLLGRAVIDNREGSLILSVLVVECVGSVASEGDVVV